MGGLRVDGWMIRRMNEWLDAEVKLTEGCGMMNGCVGIERRKSGWMNKKMRGLIARCISSRQID